MTKHERELVIKAMLANTEADFLRYQCDLLAYLATDARNAGEIEPMAYARAMIQINQARSKPLSN